MHDKSEPLRFAMALGGVLAVRVVYALLGGRRGVETPAHQSRT